MDQVSSVNNVVPVRLPRVTVLMCTRNRKDNMLSAVRSVLACDYPDFELIVLDQSDGAATEHALAALAQGDARLRYVHLDFAGKPRALNRGLESARGDYVLLTDDDCEAAPNWIRMMVGALQADPTLGCVFGDVAAVEHDAAQGYIPVCPIREYARVTRVAEFVPVPPNGHYGMGANMGFPLRALKAVGGWDPCIGPGTRFGSGDDMDMSVRILRAGFAIGFSPEAHILHYGLRSWNSGWSDRARTGFGLGSIFAKHLRTGAIFGGALVAMGSASRKSLARAVRGQRPIGLAYPLGWLRGVAAGFRHPLDRESGQFVLEQEPISRRYREQFARIEFSVREPPKRAAGSGKS